MSVATQTPTPQPAPSPNVAIRAKPPSPRRLSRKVLVAATLAAGAVVAFALVNGLSERPDRRAAQQQEVAAAGGPPESIRGASDQYGAHDLAGEELQFGDADLVAVEGDGAELQPPRDPMWANNTNGGAGGPAAPPAPDPQAVARTSAILFTRDAENAQAPLDTEARLNARLTPPGSRYEIKAGDVIPAALVTALNSDLPGRIIAQVTAPVYDTITGDHLLIPQGARLIGTYESGVRYGDNRILLVWNRLVLPNGWSINLQEMNATDASGASGVRDSVDNHLGRLGVAIGLSAIISVVANEAEDDGEDNTSLTQSVGDAAATQAAQTGSRIVDRELQVHPTLRVRAGAPVLVLVTRDIQLRPYVPRH
ncbi:MAG: TrbI/VirB10 family protein [Hyphomonadaceae bacterium]|jgi:type IV secretion system protein VirB10|nr:TrbI/VirB10 family protein [Hyphomonadaceae bacterium]